MANPDSLQRFTFDNSHVRGELVGLNQTLKDIFARQSYPEAVNNLLGELLAAAALLSATVKIDGLLTLQVQSNGPLRILLAETSHDGKLRGIARMDAEQDIEDGQLLGTEGQLVITIDPTKGRRYQGIVSLEGDNLAKCLEGYFKQSEQLATRLWLSCEGQVAAGFLLQELPALGEVQEEMEVDADAWTRLTCIADTVRDDELLHLDNSQLLHRLYHEEPLRLFAEEAIKFSCSCSKARLSTALDQMGYEQCQEIIDEQQKIRADCQFCGQHYSFDQGDVKGLFPLESAKASGQSH
ncbi:MAG: Hsp33 family molecular chaperone HslO [Bermanella sp.]